jgi:hypothetical protein
MTRARIIDQFGNVEEVSDREFYTRIFGRPPRTKEQREAEWQAACERYADWIETGDDWAVPPPYLHDARRIAAERAQLAKCEGDPLLKKRRVG